MRADGHSTLAHKGCCSRYLAKTKVFTATDTDRYAGFQGSADFCHHV